MPRKSPSSNMKRQVNTYKKIGKALAEGAAKSMSGKKKPKKAASPKKPYSRGVTGKQRSRNIDRAVRNMSEGRRPSGRR